MASDKIILTRGDVDIISVRLAVELYEKDFIPDAIVAIWRGGTNTTSYLSSALTKLGKQPWTTSITAKSYDPGIANQSEGIQIYNVEESVRILRALEHRNVLFSDDVFDTGRTWHAVRYIMRNGLRVTDADNKNGIFYEYRMRTGRGHEYTMQVPLITDIDPLQADIRFATPYRKPQANLTELQPDFYIEDVPLDDEGEPKWLVFPWERAEDLNDEELRRISPEVHAILNARNRLQ